MKKIIIIFVSIFLFSCAGTGAKSDSYIPELDSGEQTSGKIMVLRDTGWTAGAQVISVKLNGQEISQLRPKQIVVSDSTPQVLHYQCSAHGNMGWALTTSTRNLTGFDTDDLSEGSSNLYHTTARVNSAIDSRVNATFVNNLTIVADTATALGASLLNVLSQRVNPTSSATFESMKSMFTIPFVALLDAFIFIITGWNSPDSIGLCFVGLYFLIASFIPSVHASSVGSFVMVIING